MQGLRLEARSLPCLRPHAEVIAHPIAYFRLQSMGIGDVAAGMAGTWRGIGGTEAWFRMASGRTSRSTGRAERTRASERGGSAAGVATKL